MLPDECRVDCSSNVTGFAAESTFHQPLTASDATGQTCSCHGDTRISDEL